MRFRYRSGLVLRRYRSNRRRRLTRINRPRREEWSLWCPLRCSVKSPILLLRTATCTSVEPTSFPWVRYVAIISCFACDSKGIIVRLSTPLFFFARLDYFVSVAQSFAALSGWSRSKSACKYTLFNMIRRFGRLRVTPALLRSGGESRKSDVGSE